MLVERPSCASLCDKESCKGRYYSLNRYNAEICLYKPWRPKVFFQAKNLLSPWFIQNYFGVVTVKYFATQQFSRGPYDFNKFVT